MESATAISTHALLAEGDLVAGLNEPLYRQHFNPRPPCGGRRYPKLWMHSTTCYFNPRPPCGGRLLPAVLQRDYEDISTHALLAEGDGKISQQQLDAAQFQPTPSLRRATNDSGLANPETVFQPTPSLRRATALNDNYIRSLEFQPTPSLRRATPRYRRPSLAIVFQPTPSLRRATRIRSRLTREARISTHALLAEGDLELVHKLTDTIKFQPTPSLRRATLAEERSKATAVFQPTPSLRRATIVFLLEGLAVRISTHALLAEGDAVSASYHKPIPCISTHALLAEGDAQNSLARRRLEHFNPRPPCGGRRQT